MTLPKRDDMEFLFRMKHEREELYIKIESLSDFLIQDSKQRIISGYERLMLAAQYRAMRDYASCLEERIIFYENRMKESDNIDSEA